MGSFSEKTPVFTVANKNLITDHHLLYSFLGSHNPPTGPPSCQIHYQLKTLTLAVNSNCNVLYKDTCLACSLLPSRLLSGNKKQFISTVIFLSAYQDLQLLVTLITTQHLTFLCLTCMAGLPPPVIQKAQQEQILYPQTGKEWLEPNSHLNVYQLTEWMGLSGIRYICMSTYTYVFHFLRHVF